MKNLMILAMCGLMLVVTAHANAAEGTTMRVVVVQTDDAAAYADEIRKGKKLLHAVAPNMSMRAWQATFAGTSTGTVVVALEYPGSLADFSMAWEKTVADKKIAKWLGGLSGLRTIVSDSLYTEIAN